MLIPAPFYPAFVNDLSVRAAVVPWAVAASEHNPGGRHVPTVRDLEEAAEAAEKAGHPVRVLLLTNPSNPLGVVWDADAMATMIKWCLRRGVHCVSDEIYALSIFDEAAASHFVSAAVLAEREDVRAEGDAENLVHVVWGLSKDFCGSGLRVGCLWSQNEALNTAMNNVSYFCAVGNYQQHVLAAALEAEEATDAFLAANRARLRQAAELVCAGLEEAHVPFVRPEAGMFVWVDLRGALRAQSAEGERALWQELLDSKKLLLTPGQDCRGSQPGWFLCCFAAVPEAAVREGVQRLGQFVKDEARRFIKGMPRPAYD